MKISVIGTGYVGLVTGTCFADTGNDVLCLDIDADKIARLQRGEIPIFEPGLDALVLRNVQAGRLRFTTDIAESAQHGAVQFIAVGTPPGEDGSADLQYVLAAAKGIATHMQQDVIVVDKSTVPVGTAEKVAAAMQEILRTRSHAPSVHVVSNPEFLKEGAAIADFMRPNRVVIGTDSPHAAQVMRELYKPLQRQHERVIVMDVRSAELTKYAANAMLATRISFMNELANLAETLGADIEQVRLGIGSDERIGYHFLYPGCGYGGSCFPKDVQALQRTATEHGYPLRILEAVEKVNTRQKSRLLEKVCAEFGDDLSQLQFALWGLAFKPNTDDMREAPSLVLIQGLLARGAHITAYDPVAINEAKRHIGEKTGLCYASSPIAATRGADALIIVTEWKEFRSPDFVQLKNNLKQGFIFDGRNLYEPSTVQKHGLHYRAMGRKTEKDCL